MISEMNADALDKEFAKRLPKNPKFHVWLDSQIRPTIGATVKPGVGTSRPEVGNAIFSEMLQVLSTACQHMIPPDLMSEAYITYSMGKWQRIEEFHLKFHLSTAAFLALTDALCEEDGRNLLHDDREKLQQKAEQYNKSEKLRNFFKTDEYSDRHCVQNLHIATASELDYPLICIYQLKDGNETTLFSAADLPNALSSLERYVSHTLGEEGYSIGMVATLPPPGPDPTPAEVSYQVAAVIKEENFARLTGKVEEAVKRSWGWKPAIRQRHASMVGATDRPHGHLLERRQWRGRGRRAGPRGRRESWDRRRDRPERRRWTTGYREAERRTSYDGDGDQRRRSHGDEYQRMSYHDDVRRRTTHHGGRSRPSES